MCDLSSVNANVYTSNRFAVDAQWIRNRFASSYDSGGSGIPHNVPNSNASNVCFLSSSKWLDLKSIFICKLSHCTIRCGGIVGSYSVSNATYTSTIY